MIDWLVAEHPAFEEDQVNRWFDDPVHASISLAGESTFVVSWDFDLVSFTILEVFQSFSSESHVVSPGNSSSGQEEVAVSQFLLVCSGEVEVIVRYDSHVDVEASQSNLKALGKGRLSSTLRQGEPNTDGLAFDNLTLKPESDWQVE